MSDSQKSQPLVDLSELRLMPKWVAEFGKTSSSSAPDFEESQRPRRQGRDRDRRFSGPRGDFRGPRSDSNQGARERRGPQDHRSRDNRSPRGPENRGGKRDGRDGRDRQRHRDQDRRQPEVQVQLPEGLNAEIEPETRAVEAMAAMIRNASKAYSVFDAARLVLSSGDRYHVKFSLPKDSNAKLYAIPADGSLWLSRAEAIEHFLNSEGIKEFYRVEEVQLEAPKGVFTNIAICGLSGELLGPTSHHSYQSNLHRVHRERFSHLPFEEYKRRVRIDNNPELIEKWKDAQSHGTHWIPITPDEKVAFEEASTGEASPDSAPSSTSEEQPQASVADTTDSVDATPTEEAAEVATESPEVTEAATENAGDTEAAQSQPDSNGIRLKSRAEMQEHFRAHFAPTLIHETNLRYIAGNIPKNLLNPALYHLLRRSVDETRKHLLGLAQRLCIGFEHNGLKLFKRRGGKLWVSRTRPRLLDNTVVLSERIARMMEIVKAQPGISAKALIEAVSPSTASATETSSETKEESTNISASASEIVEATSADLTTGDLSTPEASHEPNPVQVEALKDLHWLNSEGYVIEYADGLVFPGVTEPPPAKPKAPKVKNTPSTDSLEAPSVESTEGEVDTTTIEEISSLDASSAEVEAETIPVSESTPAPTSDVNEAVSSDKDAAITADSTEETESNITTEN